MSDRHPVSIVVPTLNEADNISLLLRRIDATFQTIGADYEVLIIDDHSSDDTLMIANSLASTYPVRSYLKKGDRGKAQSLLEGFELARYPLTAMIDADLQYAPEELAPMYKLLVDTDADVVITDRKERTSSPVRKLMTKVYNLVFARLLFGIKFDTQSGLKLFKSDVMNGVAMNPSPWTFDLEFLVRALENKRKIISHTIEFNERHAGVTKVKVISSSIDMAKASVKLRWRTSHRKTREGYRANDRFLKRAFGTFVFALLLANLSAGFVPKTSAAALPGSGLVHSVQNLLGGNSDSKQQSGKGSSQQSSQTPSSSTTTTPSSTTQPATTQTSTTSSQASQPATTSTTSTTSTASRKSTSQQASSQPASNAESGTLGAATSTNKLASAYGGSYPNYKLSSSSTNRLNHAANVVIASGLTCLVIATGAIAYRLQRTHNYFKSLRT